MPWTINSEIYPLWARSVCTGIATSVNWGSNLLVSFTFLTVMNIFGHSGGFAMYAVLCLLGLIIFYKVMPETKGVSLEKMDALFDGKNGARDSMIYSRISNPLED